jgi:translation initiation factor IF-2
MNERVRIYELARQMNIPSQDMVTALREMGYDVKSHSSTIDSSTVGLLISQLGKKKQSQEKSTAKTTKTPKVAAAPVKAPPPEPVVVKPRVLSRRKPTTEVATPIGEPIETPVVEVQEPVQPTVVTPEPTPVQPEADPTKAQPRVIRRAEQPGEKTAESKPAEVLEPVAKETAKEPVIAEEIEIEKIQELPAKNEPEYDFKPDALTAPAKPSQPIRVAAPSSRAVPPRAPKSHRQTPQERHQPRREEKKSAAATVEVPKIVVISKPMTVKELSEKMIVSETEVIKRLFMKGIMRTVNQVVEIDAARELAKEMEYEVLTEEIAVEPEKAVELTAEEEAFLVTRPPVVTIMGHVDHGKTSLLDAIRQTKFLLTDSEAGGITQHIGAYHVEVPGDDGSMRQIVFLDTPGHEAFTAMRARGAKATDVAILVVAADDGVMPQTIEAIDHAKAAGVPIIVAVNKIDKAEAEPDRVLTQLMEHELLPDKFGGDTVTVNVSAKKRTGLDELLEMILLVADMQDLKANPDKPATGVIVEAELSKGRGAVATALVQGGTLREGDFLICGTTSGRVRALLDDRGNRVKAAGPSMPVEVLGLEEVPQAGDRFEVIDDIQQARAIVEQRRIKDNERRGHRVTLESLHDMIELGEVKELNVIIKADVQGTAEAIAESVKKLSGKEVQVRVLRTASGNISENDVNLAASSDAIIIGFNVQPDQNANRVKELAGVDVRTYSIIYQITDDLEKAIQGLIQPVKEEVEVGIAEIRQIFKNKNIAIAGCYVTNGKIQRGSIARVKRGNEIVFEGKLDNLKRFKDDAREVAQGFECGISFDKFNDFKEGDLVHCYVVQEVKQDAKREAAR